MAAASTPPRSSPWRPQKLPPELHWFKWEAYTTLITGFFLLCLVYYYGAEVALIDPVGDAAHQARSDRHRARLPGAGLAGL